MTASSRYKLIVGLGNPGDVYENTYHNVGRLFLAYLTKNAEMKTARGFEYAKVGNNAFVRPLHSMNQSGNAIFTAMKYFKLKPEQMLVIQDDSDIELGKYKISFGRGSAGHKGVDSVIKAIGTKNFSRLRIGIRPKANPPSSKLRRARAGDFVLKKISKDNLRVIEKLYPLIRVNLALE